MHIPEAGEGAGRCWDQSGAIYQPLHPGMAFEAGGQRRSALRVGEGGGSGLGWDGALRCLGCLCLKDGGTRVRVPSAALL